VLVGPRGRRRLIKRKIMFGEGGVNTRGGGGNWRGRGAIWRGGEEERRMPAQNSHLRDSRWDLDGVRETARGPMRGNQRGRGRGSMRGMGRTPVEQQEHERDLERERCGEEEVGARSGEEERGGDLHIRATPPIPEEGEGEEEEEELARLTGRSKRTRVDDSLSPPLKPQKKKTT